MLFSKLERKINDEQCDLIVLDEIVDAINLNLIDEERLISLLSEKKCEIVMTGRNPSEKLIEISEVEYAGALAVLAEGDAADRNDIIYLEKLPLFDSEGKAL